MLRLHHSRMFCWMRPRKAEMAGHISQCGCGLSPERWAELQKAKALLTKRDRPELAGPPERTADGALAELTFP